MMQNLQQKVLLKLKTAIGFQNQEATVALLKPQKKMKEEYRKRL